MIRNVVLAKLKAGVTEDQVATAVETLRSMRTPGMISITVGRDLGLRDGNWDMAVVTDLEDVESYRIYDTDAEHNRIRREVVAPITERLERIQYEV
ncbi:MAG TPA: Dabb family protein [Candidatus Udaeobacter sp.]|nr:Dabb family protein [Candidatus Udaeobacter sp.]